MGLINPTTQGLDLGLRHDARAVPAEVVLPVFTHPGNQAAGLLIGLHIAETTVHKDPPFGLMFNQVDGAVPDMTMVTGP